MSCAIHAERRPPGLRVSWPVIANNGTAVQSGYENLGLVCSVGFVVGAGRSCQIRLVVGIDTGKYTPRRLALGLATALVYLILFGWIIPLCVGVWRLSLRLTHRLR